MIARRTATRRGPLASPDLATAGESPQERGQLHTQPVREGMQSGEAGRVLPPLFELTDHVHRDTGTLRQVFLREIGQAPQAPQAPECLSEVLFARYHAATLRREGA